MDAYLEILTIYQVKIWTYNIQAFKTVHTYKQLATYLTGETIWQMYMNSSVTSKRPEWRHSVDSETTSWALPLGPVLWFREDITVMPLSALWRFSNSSMVRFVTTPDRWQFSYVINAVA